MLSLVVWNVAWRALGSREGRLLRSRIDACEPDIVCITEGMPTFLDLPHRIEAPQSHGYLRRDDGRKVILWSRQPWTAVDVLGDPEMPGGRYVAGQTTTQAGNVMVHGVCVPWRQAHVSTGRRDSRPWQEHLAYLAGLRRVLARPRPAQPLLVVGDYNQFIPRRTASTEAFAALCAAIPAWLQCATAGPLPPDGQSLVDHVHHSTDLMAASVHVLSNKGEDGRELSDHPGLHLLLRASGSRGE